MTGKMHDDRLKKALKRFAEQLELHTEKQLLLIVAGGAGLVLSNHTKVGTYDVDVIGLEKSGQIVAPDWSDYPGFKQCRQNVARELGLEQDWINAGPSKLLKKLPEGFRERLAQKTRELEFGNQVVVKPLPRYDQVLLKTYAALNVSMNHPKYDKHRGDLKDLKPGVMEIAEGVRWSLENCEDFPDSIEDLVIPLRELGRDLEIRGLADRVKTKIKVEGD